MSNFMSLALVGVLYVGFYAIVLSGWVILRCVFGEAVYLGYSDCITASICALLILSNLRIRCVRKDKEATDET